MRGVITQIVVGSPPSVACPVIELRSAGKLHVFDEKSVTVHLKKAFVSDGKFWLVFTGEVEVGKDMEVALFGRPAEQRCTLALESPASGITRFFRKDFRSDHKLPRDIFLDVVVQDAPAAYVAAMPTKMVVPAPFPKNLPPPPGMRVGPAVKKLEMRHPTLVTLCTRVRWIPATNIRGSVYEHPAKYFLDTDWTEMENTFIRQFCKTREKTPLAPVLPPAPQKKTRILSEKQEFLLSIIVGALEKKGITLAALGKSISDWIDHGTEIAQSEAANSLSEVFPSEVECAEIVALPEADLSETEHKLLPLLCIPAIRGKLLLSKYISTTEPLILQMQADLSGLTLSLAAATRDENLPRFLLFCLRLGNAVNFRYSELENASEARGFLLSSLPAFAKSFGESLVQEKYVSMLAFLVVALRNAVDFGKILATFKFFKTLQIKTLAEQVLFIKKGMDGVVLSSDFPGKKEKVGYFIHLINEIDTCLTDTHEKLATISKKYADVPDTFVTSVSLALDALEEVSHLFQ
ncbi:hypothetical protein NEDG_01310 [Nematocida displodere]|uniref:FH2 domain-containing protein n=1 Tax=Nematocida displodere TaxID=1805483 RepID=A0A177EBB9_9MICR|nr:hypothetical protein NEDG_01310 [Nematocida displodere]